MCQDCCCNDDREMERDLARMEAEGRFHNVTMRVKLRHTIGDDLMEVTLQGSVDVTGPNHETADLEDYVDQAVEVGEVVDWEPAEAEDHLDEIIEHGETVDWDEV